MGVIYATEAELRTQINKLGITGSGGIVAVDLLLDAATKTIDNYCNRPDGFVALAVAATRPFPGSGKSYQWIDDCVAITKVEVKDSPSDIAYVTWTNPTTDYAGDGDWIPFRGDPSSPVFGQLPYHAIMIDPNGDYSSFCSGMYAGLTGFRPSEAGSRSVPTVKITAKWGYAASAPAGIKSACIALAARWFKQGEGAWADTMASPELGSLIYRKENVDIKMMLERFKKPAIGRR